MLTTTPETMTKAERTRAELSYGLGQFVADYRAALAAGDTTTGAQMGEWIEVCIAERDLDRDMVYGAA